jgi:hypothetical protein
MGGDDSCPFERTSGSLRPQAAAEYRWPAQRRFKDVVLAASGLQMRQNIGGRPQLKLLFDVLLEASSGGRI